MEKQRLGRLIYIIAYLTMILEVDESISVSEVFSQIDLDDGSHDGDGTSDILKVFAASTTPKSSYTETTTNGRIVVKQQAPRIRESYRKLVGSPTIDDTRKRRTSYVLPTNFYNFRRQNDEFECSQKVINNIHIVLNGNGTQDEANVDGSCNNNGICNVSVISRPDDRGNIVTDVHLSVVTNVNANIKVQDIPVIDGIHGVENTLDDLSSFSSTSRFANRQPRPFYSHSMRNHVPQSRGFFDFTDARPATSILGTFETPQSLLWYHNARSGDFGPWRVPRIRVDDKIGAPLSKTEQ